MPYLVLDPTAAQAAPTVSFGAPETAATHPLGKSLLAMRTRLILELGRRDDIPAPVWNEWINDAYNEFYASLPLPETQESYGQTLVAGQPLYLTPLSVDAIRTVSASDPADATSGATLEKKDQVFYRKLPVRSGQPEFWFHENRMLVFWPTPDAAYPVTIDCFVNPLPLTADTDYPALDDKWHEPLLKAAKYRAWEGVQNDAKAALVSNETSRLIQRRNDRDALDQDTEYPSMRPVFSHRDLMALRRHSQRFSR